MSSTDGSPPRPVLAQLWRVGLRLLAVAGLVLVIGNVTILVGTFAARVEEPTPTIDVAGIDNFRVVDERVVRGDAPTGLGYRSLASLGVTTVADLRAEHDLGVPESLLEELGMERVALPIRDGQTPTPDQVERFAQAVDASPGLVYLHCGAGVGRTGAMAAAYLVATGQRSGGGALIANLSVGPPSLEQVLYAATLDSDRTPRQPPVVVKVVSRFLDGPRRIWSVIG